MNKELLTFLEEIRKQMANRYVAFKSVSGNGECELQAFIGPENSIRDIIDDALKSGVINENLHREFIDCCCIIEPEVYFYTKHDDAGLYIEYSYTKRGCGEHFECVNGAILTPEEGPIGPTNLSNRIIEVIYDSFRTMYISDGIILDIPEPNYRLYDDGSDRALRNFSEFARFITTSLMLRGEDPMI